MKKFLAVLSFEGKNYLVADYINETVPENPEESRPVSAVSFDSIEDIIKGFGSFEMPTDKKSNEFDLVDFLVVPSLFKEVLEKAVALKALNPKVIEIDLDLTSKEEVGSFMRSIVTGDSPAEMNYSDFQVIVIPLKDDISHVNPTEIINQIFPEDFIEKAMNWIKTTFNMSDEDFQKRVQEITEQRELDRKAMLD